MAERRMFAKSIIDSDAFLDMPLSAQALYFHLSMRADDEGFVGNPKRIRSMIGASEDDLKLLILKRFVLVFESGVVVIKHWKIHNYIQNDRSKPTTYLEERNTLALDGKKAYVEKMDTECIQNGYNLDTQVSIGKDSIEEIYTTPKESILLANSAQAHARVGQNEKPTYMSQINERLRKNCHLGFYLTRLNDDVKSNPQLQQHIDAFNKVLEILYRPSSEADVKAVLQLTEEKFIKIVNKLIPTADGIEDLQAYVWTSVHNAVKESA